MEEKNVRELQEFKKLLQEKKYAALRGKAQDMNEADVAEIMSNLDDVDMLRMFRLFPKELAADVFSMLENDDQQYIITQLSESEAGSIIDMLQSDDAVDLLEEMPANVVKRLLANAREDTRADINHLLKYEEDSAGSIMTVEFVDLKAEMTVMDAIDRIRAVGLESETVNTCYVLNPKRLLLGTVALRYLLLRQPDEIIGDFMNEEVISCNTGTDQEKVAQIFKKYDFEALPVVDNENRMVGIITVDDVMDIMEAEMTEDIERMAAIIPNDKPYLKTGPIETWKKRFPWLLLLMVSATFTGKIITSFESALNQYIILAAYIPMLMDTGGNAGSQASTEVVRGLSLDQIHFEDFFKVAWKEMRVGLMCGATLAFANLVKCVYLDHVSMAVALTVCMTIIMDVFISKLVSSMLTILVDHANLDPAVVASPLLTTIIDASSLMIYFSIAKVMLGI